MPKTDAYEEELLAAFEKGEFNSVATTEERARIKTAAHATGIKDRRVNIQAFLGQHPMAERPRFLS